MKDRIISGTIIALIFALGFFLGPVAFKILIGAVAILAYKEIITLPKVMDKLNLPIIILGLIGFMALIYIVNDGYALYLGVSYQTIAFLLFGMVIPTIFSKKYDTETSLFMFTLLFLLGMALNSMVMLDSINKWILLYVIIVICATDIFALFIGSYIGTHKLSSISPHKAIEGSLGGIICASIIGTFYYLAVIGNTSVLRIVLMSILISVFGQIGDLFFSKIKRENKIKDYSNLIKGHGGILDRIDSLVFGILLYTLLCTIL